jgi:hypothetical protein
MAVYHEYVQPDGLSRDAFLDQLRISESEMIGSCPSDLSSEANFRFTLSMNDVCLRGVTHGSTYSAVGRPRPEDVNPDLPASLQISAGSALNILLQPENFFGLSRWVLPCFVCQHAARLNPYSSLTKDWRRKRAVAKSKLPPGCIQFPITALQSKCYSVVIDLPKGNYWYNRAGPVARYPSASQMRKCS